MSIDTLLDDMEKGKLQVVDNAFNGKFHDQVWHDLTGKQGQAPAAYEIGNAVRVDLNRLTPEQLPALRGVCAETGCGKRTALTSLGRRLRAAAAQWQRKSFSGIETL